MSQTISAVRSVIKEAERLELGKSHDFHQLDTATGYRLNTAPSPRLSRSRLWYLDCARCGRAVIEGGLGSARDGADCRFDR